MKQDNDFEYLDNALEQFGKIVSENNDFDEMKEDIYKLTKSMIADFPKVSQEIIIEYNAYIQTMLLNRGKYKDCYDKLIQQTEEQTVRNEYASGGECIHRGFYCPSPVLDKIVGGFNRGKKINKPRANSCNYYKYYINDKNKIIRSDKYEHGRCSETEFIIFESNNIYGISFSTQDHLTGLLSLEQYSDRGILVKYITILPDFYTGRENHSIYSAEKYEYDEHNILQRVIYATGIPNINLITEEKYNIINDSNNRVCFCNPSKQFDID